MEYEAEGVRWVLEGGGGGRDLRGKRQTHGLPQCVCLVYLVLPTT